MMPHGRRAAVAAALVAVLGWAASLCESEASAPARHERVGKELGQRFDAAGAAEEAISHLRESLWMRPTSAYTWAALAAGSYRTGVANETLQPALVRAALLGPNEPEVQETVAFYGLAIWPEATPETRAAVREMTAAGLRRDAAAMLHIAQRRGRLDLACGWLDPAWRARQDVADVCKPMGAK